LLFYRVVFLALSLANAFIRFPEIDVCRNKIQIFVANQPSMSLEERMVGTAGFEPATDGSMDNDHYCLNITTLSEELIIYLINGKLTM